MSEHTVHSLVTLITATEAPLLEKKVALSMIIGKGYDIVINGITLSLNNLPTFVS